MRRTEYLQRRRGRWYVRLRVPAHLTATVGQQHFVRALDTESETVARERRWIALALLWDWIGAQTVSDGWQPAWAAQLTGSPRSSDDRAPSPTEVPPQNPADRARQGVHHPQRPSGAQHQQHTILAMMERWLKEIEGVHTTRRRPSWRARQACGFIMPSALTSSSTERPSSCSTATLPTRSRKLVIGKAVRSCGRKP